MVSGLVDAGGEACEITRNISPSARQAVFGWQEQSAFAYDDYDERQ